jgi:hypothetical protein
MHMWLACSMIKVKVDINILLFVKYDGKCSYCDCRMIVGLDMARRTPRSQPVI